MQTVSIDFVAGSHGHFLEYVCNKWIAKLDMDFSPFNQLGSSHVQTVNYRFAKVFVADHYALKKRMPSQKLVKIVFDADDLLPLSSICFLRAGDANVDTDQLEHDTYHKLNNDYYRDLIRQINQAYPDVCLTPDNPHCPRYVLREFFKFGFIDTHTHGLMLELSAMQYPNNHQVFDFAFANFYDQKSFIAAMHDLAQWFGVNLDNQHLLSALHEEFLTRQIYKHDKQQCDDIIQSVMQQNHQPISNLRLLQESYINGTLEKLLGIEMPFAQTTYFSHTQDIIEHVQSCHKTQTSDLGVT